MIRNIAAGKVLARHLRQRQNLSSLRKAANRLVDGQERHSPLCRVAAPCGARLADAQAEHFLLNEAFNLGSYFMTNHSRFPRCVFDPLNESSSRVAPQMERYRSQPVFGLLENKLLIKRVLSALGIPFVPSIYGALPPAAPHSAAADRGVLPAYSRRALHNATASWPSEGLVVTMATDGMGRNNRRVSMQVRRPDRDSAAGLADMAEGLLQNSAQISRSWKQGYAHHALLVEPRYDAVVSARYV